MFCRILLLISVIVVSGQNYKLNQVLILSRHNVRTPLSKYLNMYSPKPWPAWNEKRGYLTEKGAILEGYLGEYLACWLRKEGLLTEQCPNESEFYVYGNTAQRTMATARAFVSKAFPDCNITVNHTDKDSDPIFNPYIHNNSTEFKIAAKEEMEKLLRTLHMNDSYEYLAKIIDYKESEKCLKESKCDLISDKNKVYIATGEKPSLVGPLKICKSVIDSFIMENYEGFPLEEVAWGNLIDSDNWNKIIGLSRGYHNVIFNISMIAKDIAQPLVDYMKDILLNKDYRVALLMGHDANLYTVLKSFSFKPYNLIQQYEKVPAGGKIVFQKWYDEVSKEFYLKTDYVYSTTAQMRKGVKLSFENPPMMTPLEMDGCKLNEFGMCLWDDFVSVLNNL